MLPDITLGLSKQRNTCAGRDIPSEVLGSFKGELYCSLSDSAATLNCALEDSDIEEKVGKGGKQEKKKKKKKKKKKNVDAGPVSTLFPYR